MTADSVAGGVRRLSAVHLGLLLTACYAVLIGCWSLAAPPFAQPDETSHVARAASLMDGDLLSSRAGTNAPADPSNLVFVPTALAGDAQNLGCYAHHASVPASCLQLRPDDTEQTAVYSAAARYLPLYYLVVGWPSGYVHTQAALWAMRALSALCCAALLALATVAAIRLGGTGRPWVPVGLLAAVTPTVLFLSAGVNPASVAVCAGVAVWTLGLLVLRAPPATARRGLAWLSGAAAVMLLTRSDSPIWLALILLALVAAGRGRLRTLPLRRRDVVPAAGVVLGATALNLGWTVYSGMLSIGAPPDWQVRHDGFLAAARLAVEQVPLWTRQAIAGFGWRDTYLLAPVYLLVLVTLVLLWRAARPSARTCALAAAVLAAGVVVSVGMQAHEYDTLGYWWQGRYVLPLLAGVPLLLAYGAGSTTRSARRLAVAAAGIPVVLATTGLVVWLHRSMNGLGRTFSWNAPWGPPVPAQLLIAVSVVALLAIAAISLTPVFARTRS